MVALWRDGAERGGGLWWREYPSLHQLPRCRKSYRPFQKKRRKRYTSLLPAVLKSWAIFGRCKGLSLQKTIPAILANPNMRSKAQ